MARFVREQSKNNPSRNDECVSKAVRSNGTGAVNWAEVVAVEARLKSVAITGDWVFEDALRVLPFIPQQMFFVSLT